VPNCRQEWCRVFFICWKFYHDIRSADKHEITYIALSDKFKLEGFGHGLLLVGRDNLHITRCIWKKYKALSFLPVISLVGIFTLFHSDMSISV